MWDAVFGREQDLGLHNKPYWDRLHVPDSLLRESGGQACRSSQDADPTADPGDVAE